MHCVAERISLIFVTLLLLPANIYILWPHAKQAAKIAYAKAVADYKRIALGERS